MNSYAEFISLILTVPTLVLSSWVCKMYGPTALAAARKLANRETVNEQEYLIMGITAGFAGAFADNAYWGLAWCAEFLNLSSAGWLFSHGVYSNLPFRQGAGILAASLHLMLSLSASRVARVRYWLVWILAIVSAGPLLLAYSLLNG